MANIVIMPGGFHPFHAGHAALYNSIKQKYGEGSDIYVAASNNQKERPFPFEIKEKLAQLSGVQPGEFVQVKSPFVPKEITDKYDPDKDTIVFVRSEKDKDEFPKPGAVKKDGSPGYFQHIDQAKRGAQPFSKVGYMDYLPVKEFAGITSATQIRDTWPSLNDEQREEFITHIYPKLEGNDRLIKNVVNLLSKGMSLNEGLAYIDKDGNRVDYTRPDLPTDIENLVIDWFNDRDKYTKATLQSKGYKVDVDDKFNNIDITDKRGRKYTVSTDDAMSKLIQQAYAEPLNEDSNDKLLDTKRARAILQLYTRTNGFDLRKIISSRKRGGADNERIVTAMLMPDSKTFSRDDIDNLSDELQRRFSVTVPRMTITGNGTYLNLNPVVVKVKNMDETFVSPDESKQYWNHNPQNYPFGDQIDMPLRDTDRNGRRQGFSGHGSWSVNESFGKIRNMINDSTDEQKSKSVDLHRKMFELLENEFKPNVIKLRGFGREQDKEIPDINKVRQEKEKEKQRNQVEYDNKRQQQYAYLRKIQEVLFELHEEFAEMEQLGLLPIEMKQNFENVKELIDFVENYSADDYPFTDDDGNLLEMLHVKTVKLKEYFGGWRDTQAPRVLRKHTPKLEPDSFWNKFDLSETADYIEEK